jgi:thioredoxin-like negative regulator of GroEL
MCAFVVSCAEKAKAPPHKVIKKPTAEEPTERPKPSNVAPVTAVSVPERNASGKLVASGKALLEKGEVDRAIASFRDAANVDPTNGEAYFCLALAYVRSGQVELAFGVLDKAESLLGADAEWKAKIDELRMEAGGEEPPASYEKTPPSGGF